MNTNIYGYILCAFGAAIIAVLAQITIPIPLVPITGQTLGIGLIVTILGKKYGTIAVLLYVLLGAVGLPVYANFSGGLSILVGPTGGYIVGFIAQAIIMGIYLEKFGYTFVHALISNLIGMIVTLAFGTVWLKIAASLTWQGAFLAGTVPFIIVGIIKAVIAAWIGILVRNRLLNAKLLERLA